MRIYICKQKLMCSKKVAFQMSQVLLWQEVFNKFLVPKEKRWINFF